VAYGNGAERPGVVDEPGGVVEAGRVGDRLPEAPHGVGGVEEPPRRPQVERGVTAGQRGQLPAVRVLVERVDHHPQPRIVAVLVQQRRQRVHIVGGLRDVPAHVPAVRGVQPLVVVARRARVQLQDETVVDRHPGELEQHVRPERLGVGRRRRPAQPPLVQSGGLLGGDLEGPGGGMTVVRGGRAGGDEGLPARAQGVQVPGVRLRVLAGDLAEPADRTRPTGELQVGDVVGPERADHPPAGPAPAVGGQLGVPGQVVQG
jgi:hypothetical protein